MRAPQEDAVTTETTPTPPTFAIRSSGRALARDVAIVALCAALAAGFLAQVWRPAPPPADVEAASAAASTTGRS